jgi:hypothetical protein
MEDIETPEEAREHLTTKFSFLNYKDYDITVLASMLLHVAMSDFISTPNENDTLNTPRSIALLLLDTDLEFRANSFSESLAKWLNADYPNLVTPNLDLIANAIIDTVTDKIEANMDNARSQLQQLANDIQKTSNALETTTNTHKDMLVVNQPR